MTTDGGAARSVPWWTHTGGAARCALLAAACCEIASELPDAQAGFKAFAAAAAVVDTASGRSTIGSQRRVLWGTWAVLVVAAANTAVPGALARSLYLPALALLGLAILRRDRTEAAARALARGWLQASLAIRRSEHARWARELHDETLQQLAALKLLLATAQRRGPDGTQDVLPQALGLIDQQIAGLRALIDEPRPHELDRLGIVAALQELVDRVGAWYAIPIHADLRLRPAALDPARETAVYRVVQEALTNAAQHAHSGRIRVRLIEQAQTVTAVVADDGRGFDPRHRQAGHGLTNMQERAELAGGALDVRSHPGRGTTIRLTVPTRGAPVLPEHH